MAAEQSSELKEILRLLPGDWKLEKLGPGRVRWIADLRCKNEQFRLVCDRGGIDIGKLVGGKMVAIEPPDDQRVFKTPRQIVNLLLASVKDEE